ncbi:MAG: 16S rRNA (cytidine(1402)-2'-O)-methyltransferase [Pseudomonas fluorescens]|nr:MAG: 16S rRNA (cytidine(1402)-2'-O)-methyltransferase [Pseudomonas fluorescens]
MKNQALTAPGLLQVVGTPIGNLSDLSPRAREALANAQLVACEDTRRTGQLYRLLGLTAPKMLSCYKENETARASQIVTALQQGQQVVLVSDGGMPGISDPGAHLVAAARAAGIRTEVIAGPSAVIAAVAGSGFFGGFSFVGFPERKTAALHKQLAAIKSSPLTQVFYESPQRVAATVEAMLDVFGNRPVWLARELTKMHEEWLGPDLATLHETLTARGEIKGECVIVVHGNAEEDTPVEITDAAILAKLQTGASVKDTAAWIAETTGLSKKEAYAKAQSLKN